MAIEECGVGVEVGDVEGEDDDGGVSAGRAEAAELLDVGDVVAAAFGGGAATLAQVFKFGEAFDEGEGEEEEDAEAAEPGGEGDAGGSCSGDDADGVEAGEDDDVDEDGAFETERVGQGGDAIDAKPDEELVGTTKCRAMGDARHNVRQQDSDDERGEKEKDNDGDPRDGGEISGGKGAATFARMQTVGFEVEKVVDDVGGGGAEAEAEEGKEGADDVAGGPGVGQKHGNEDESVFGPLVEADGFGPRFEWGNLFGKGADRGNFGSAEGGAEAGSGVCDHGLLAALEQTKVGRGVADVREVVGEALAECG